jgi:hypothetical protein
MDSEMTGRATNTEPNFFSAFSVGAVAVGTMVVAPVFGPDPVLACLMGVVATSSTFGPELTLAFLTGAKAAMSAFDPTSLLPPPPPWKWRSLWRPTSHFQYMPPCD